MRPAQGYSAAAVANWFIERAHSEGRLVDHLSLQKLVYIAHGWCLAIMKRPLIDDAIEAWQYGPVVPSLYHELKVYGRGPVEPIVRVRGLTLQAPTIEDSETEDLLETVWRRYGDLRAAQLVALTHAPDTPWRGAWDGARNKPIDNEAIKAHYVEKARERRQRRAS